MHACTRAALLAALLGLFACHSRGWSEPAVSYTQLTSATPQAGRFEPNGIDLYLARANGTICGARALAPLTVPAEAEAPTMDQSAQLDRLARCFTSPEMRGASIVLLGRGARGARAAAERAKALLVARGVPAERVVAAGAEPRAGEAGAAPRVEIVVAFTPAAAAGDL